MDELKNAILKSFEERFSSPLIGYIITSWIGFNWIPIVYFLFSHDLEITKRVTFSLDATSLSHLLIYPIITGVLLTLAIPFINHWVKNITSKSITMDERLTEQRTAEIEIIKAEKSAKIAESLKKIEEAKLGLDAKKILSSTLEATIAQYESHKKSIESEISASEINLEKLKVDIKDKASELEGFEKSIKEMGFDFNRYQNMDNEIIALKGDIQNFKNLSETHNNIFKKIISARISGDIKELESIDGELKVLGYAVPRPIN
ncbi:UNVERIFIED_ORG: hypothetical protein M2402_000861 [Rahnella aquatilis]